GFDGGYEDAQSWYVQSLHRSPCPGFRRFPLLLMKERFQINQGWQPRLLKTSATRDQPFSFRDNLRRTFRGRRGWYGRAIASGGVPLRHACRSGLAVLVLPGHSLCARQAARQGALFRAWRWEEQLARLRDNGI